MEDEIEVELNQDFGRTFNNFDTGWTKVTVTVGYPNLVKVSVEKEVRINLIECTYQSLVF